MLSIISSILGVTLFFNLVLAGIAYFKQDNKLEITILLFGAVLLFDGLWAACILYLINQPPVTYTVGSSAYSIAKITFFSAVMWTILKVIFYKIVFVKEKILKTLSDYIILILGLISLFGTIINNGLFTEFTIFLEGSLQPERSGVNPFFIVYIFYAYFYSIVILFRKLKKTTDDIVKKQINFLLVSHALFVGLSITTNLVLSNILKIHYFNSLGPTFTLFSLGIYAYLIQRYHFLDLRLNLQKLLSYGTTSLILTPPTYAIFNYCFTISNHPFYLCIFLALTVFLLLFFPLKKFLNKLFNLLLYSEKQNYQEKIQLLIRKLSHGKLALQQALQQIPTTLNQALNLKGCFFVPARELALFGANFKDDQVLYREELACLGELENNQVLKRTAQKMAEQKISVLAPIQQNSTCQGALAIQEKNSADKLFSTEELAAIQQLAQQTVLYLNTFAQQKRDQEYFHQFQHFFRTPFTVGLLYMQEAMNEIKKDSPAYKNLQNSCQNFQKVIRFSSNFISLMSIEWDKKYLRTATSLKRSLEKALEEIPATLNERNQTFKPKITIRGRTNLIVLGSDDTLYEVLRELIVNALIFDSGEADITISSSRKTKMVTIKIINTGTITRKEIQTALTPFGCVKGNHHSISLNFTQVFAEAVGGHFTITSGRGKTFAKLTLPLAKEVLENK